MRKFLISLLLNKIFISTIFFITTMILIFLYDMTNVLSFSVNPFSFENVLSLLAKSTCITFVLVPLFIYWPAHTVYFGIGMLFSCIYYYIYEQSHSVSLIQLLVGGSAMTLFAELLYRVLAKIIGKK